MHPINKIILGTVQLGLDYGVNNSQGQPSIHESENILSFAHSNQIYYIDTAEGYGNAIDIIAQYRKTKLSTDINIITKYAFNVSDENIDHLREKVKATLSLLRIKKLYCIHYHNFLEFSIFSSIFSNLLTLKQEGLIEHIGLSIYDNLQFETAIHTKDISVIQLPFNLLDNYSQRGVLLDKAKVMGKEIHTRSCFLQGLFFRPYHLFPEKLNPLIPYLQKLNNIASKYNIDLQTMALNYCLSQPGIDKVIIGVERLQQLADNLDKIHGSWNFDINKEVSSIKVSETNLLNPALWNQ